MNAADRPTLAPLEHDVMQVVWEQGSVTADSVRVALESTHDLKDSTVRTILRRLEAKGYVRHEVDGRVYVYQASVEPQSLAAAQVKGIVDKLCSGSVEDLLVGMVDDSMITTKKLRELADKIAKAEKQQQRSARKKQS